MPSQKIPAALTGIAGVHHVVSELSRRGMIALPTIRNTAGYDIIVVSPDGRRHANIQVKTSSKKANFWLMPLPEKVRAGRDDFYVFLRSVEDEKGFEGFMLSGREAKAELTYNVRLQRRRKGRSLQSFHVTGIWENERRRQQRAGKLER
jgi:hypothetical protein